MLNAKLLSIYKKKIFRVFSHRQFHFSYPLFKSSRVERPKAVTQDPTRAMESIQSSITSELALRGVGSRRYKVLIR